LRESRRGDSAVTPQVIGMKFAAEDACDGRVEE
jgi:hypothetical protein